MLYVKSKAKLETLRDESKTLGTASPGTQIRGNLEDLDSVVDLSLKTCF